MVEGQGSITAKTENETKVKFQERKAYLVVVKKIPILNIVT